jgi:hypothetical protein
VLGLSLVKGPLTLDMGNAVGPAYKPLKLPGGKLGGGLSSMHCREQQQYKQNS